MELLMEDLKCVDTKEASKILGVSPNTLNCWRSQSTPKNPKGPKWVNIESAVRYRIKDLEEYLSNNTMGETNK
tara:strand:+ start:127 stop:345 length:219 start_codon:yes stop_codon:yes gene_type:complete